MGLWTFIVRVRPRGPQCWFQTKSSGAPRLAFSQRQRLRVAICGLYENFCAYRYCRAGIYALKTRAARPGFLVCRYASFVADHSQDAYVFGCPLIGLLCSHTPSQF